ncbi:MAG: 3-dehydroquinate synthase, partial [Candidatus Aminicenantia bacterium]
LIIFKRFILNDIENAFLPLGGGRLFLICDSRLFEIYSSEIKGFFQNFFLLPGKDKSKSFRNVKKIWRWLLNRGVKRDSVIVSIGGGVIGDICGFVSSTILRGIKHYHIPTTLLSMLDSSIGGKNGINFDSIKNAIGTISPFQKVYIDPIFLSSIPEKELAFGLVEGIKAGFIGDFEIIELIEKKLNLIKRRDIEILEEIISRAINVKKTIVEKDPYERKLRKILNLGHTLAHALESYHKYKIPHGEAVGIGLIYSLKISEILGFSGREHIERIKFLFERLGLRKKVNGSKRDLIELMKKDKKTTERGLDFILINNSGEPFIMTGIPEEILLEALEEVIDENSHN